MTKLQSEYKLIAEYMNITVFIGINADGNSYPYYNNLELRDYDPLPSYLEDWNDLMPVISKLINEGHNITINCDIKEMYSMVINLIDNR